MTHFGTIVLKNFVFLSAYMYLVYNTAAATRGVAGFFERH